MIGVFDSGIGGLTVLNELLKTFPEENFLYLGDTARLPYGSKSPETIRKYTEQNIRFLKKQNVKAVVVACNSASTQILGLQEFEGTPLYNVIEPGALTAKNASQSQRIGVLGTRATISSGSYAQCILKLSPKAQVFSQACPLFVPLAEEAWIDDPVTNLIVYRYCQPLLQKNVDTVILGCTHYPILKNSIQKAFSNSVNLVDSGQAVADLLKVDFSNGKLKSSAEKKRTIEIMTTDHSPTQMTLAEKILEGFAFHSSLTDL